VIPAPLPENENARMEALASLNLEPGRDVVLEQIVALAAEICEAPVSLVSVVEEKRQWFKAGIGWDETETPRSVSFCGHAILEPARALVVTDATSDERFADNPLVTGPPAIHFYAGVPLLTEDGHALGSLCVIDRVPRELSAAQLRMLERLASVAAVRLRATTERLALERLIEVAAHSAAVIESALDAIVSSDADGRIIAWNPGAERTFGFTAEQAIGTTLGDLIVPPSLRASHEKGLSRYLATGEAKILGKRLELSAMHAEGHELPVELTVTEVSTEPPTFTAHLRDITERREVERLLREQNVRLRELDRMREDLITAVSHELRTPVTSISSIVELVRDDDELPAQSRELLGVLHRSAQRLGRLVNDILLIAESEAGAVSLRPELVDACAVVRDGCELAALEAERRGLELVVSCTLEEPVEADRDRIAQVVDNLVSNAVHFTSEGGVIDVRVTSGDEGHWLIEVQDSGVGVPEDEIERLFDAFYRASTASTSMIRGSGLGLSIVKAIVTAHGGTVRIDSTLGEGTKVSVELPRRFFPAAAQ
jgi:PAS domain S-box-containing protein